MDAQRVPRLPANLLAHALRRLWRHRGLTALVLFSLAFGIGVNTTLFSVVDAVLLEPLPVRDPDGLLIIQTIEPQSPRNRPMAMSHPNLLDLARRTTAFQDVAAATGATANFRVGDEIAEVMIEAVTPNFFRTLGISPSLGQLFDEASGGEVAGAPPVVVSHAFWRNRLGADPNVAGRPVQLNGALFQITGVLPKGFKGMQRLGLTEIWVPLPRSSSLLERPDWVKARRALMFLAMARLKPGVDRAAALADVQRVGTGLEREYPVDNKGRTFGLIGLSELLGEYRPEVIRAARVLLSASLIVLLIAMANVGHALLARTAVRRREMAILVALGGTRRDLLLPILTDGLILVVAGALLGLLFGVAGCQLLWYFRPEDVTADMLSLRLNVRVLAFTGLLSLAAGLLASLIPALQALRGDIADDLKERTSRGFSARRLVGLRQALVVSQVALSMAAIVSAHLFVTSFRNAQTIDPGFDSKNLATFEVNPKRLGLHGESRAIFYLELQQKLQMLEGVQSVTVSSNPLLGHDRMRRTAFLDDKTTVIPRLNAIGTRYFETADVLILRGRDFTPADRHPAPMVGIVNETMARRHFGGTDAAIGRKLRLFGDREDTTIVGVARDAAYGNLGETAEPCLYIPLRQLVPASATVLVRTSRDAASMRKPLEEAVRHFRPEMPRPEVALMSEVLDQALWAPRTAAGMLALFAILAVVLASAGVYGVTRQYVRQRTADLSVRVAMGACPVDVAELVLRQCAVLVLPGLAIGAALAYGLAHLLYDGLLYTVNGNDVRPYLWGTLLLALVALVASWLPARRAARMEPAVALREP